MPASPQFHMRQKVGRYVIQTVKCFTPDVPTVYFVIEDGTVVNSFLSLAAASRWARARRDRSALAAE